MRLALVVALLLAASPVAAQSTTSNQQQPLGAGGQIVTSPLTNTGAICERLMTATFCNVPTGPNTAGYGSNGGCCSDQHRDYCAFSGYSDLCGVSGSQRAVQLWRRRLIGAIRRIARDSDFIEVRSAGGIPAEIIRDGPNGRRLIDAREICGMA